MVGGGPAGLMAADVLASAGVAVTVFERMPSVGRKLLLAGRSGLNLTHVEPLDDLLDRYGEARVRLEPLVRAFDATAVRAWCDGLGQASYVGSSGRVFPAGFRATKLLRAWLARLEGLGVELRTRHTWRGWLDDGSLSFAGPDGDPVTVRTDATVLALGGGTWPRTGSDGAWVDPLERAGVAVAPLRPANCGFTVAWSAPFRDRFEGQPIKNVGVRHASTSVRGELVVTRTGIEGGPVYALSAGVRDELEAGRPVDLHIDLRPDLTADEIESRLRAGRPGDSVANRLRRAGFPPIAHGLLRESVPDGRLPADPATMAALVKSVPVVLRGSQPMARAISTAGGVELDQLDERLMLRRRAGTFVAGEMLDWEAPTGGYLLQASLTTGVAAGRGVLEWLAHPADRPPVEPPPTTGS